MSDGLEDATGFIIVGRWPGERFYGYRGDAAADAAWLTCHSATGTIFRVEEVRTSRRSLKYGRCT